MPEGKKIPHDPSRTVGRWAVSLNQQVFKIEVANMVDDEPIYGGPGLRGQAVVTRCPTLLTPDDHKFLEEHHGK